MKDASLASSLSSCLSLLAACVPAHLEEVEFQDRDPTSMSACSPITDKAEVREALQIAELAYEKSSLFNGKSVLTYPRLFACSAGERVLTADPNNVDDFRVWVRISREGQVLEIKRA